MVPELQVKRLLDNHAVPQGVQVCLLLVEVIANLNEVAALVALRRREFREVRDAMKRLMNVADEVNDKLQGLQSGFGIGVAIGQHVGKLLNGCNDAIPVCAVVERVVLG